MNRLFRAVAALILATTSATVHAAETLVVMTSYLDDVMSRFETAFEKAHPEIALEFRWRMPHDALDLLRAPGHGIDVYWSPAPENFYRLAEQGAFAPLPDDPGLPHQLGLMPLGDPQNRYGATEVAGYGLLVNPEYLKRHQLKTPRNLADLTAPAFAGHILLPVPSRVGFAPLFFDGLLQQHGWEGGWRAISELAANSKLANNRGTFINEEVRDGRAGVGLTMDFFAQAALATGERGRFIYLDETVFSQAYIGVFAASAHPEAAQKFAAFVRSDAGQAMLFHPVIRKLPVRPAVYKSAPAGYPNAFTLAKAHPFRFDTQRAFQRRAVVAALFDAAVTDRHTALAAAWSAVHEAEQRKNVDSTRLIKARALLGAMPVSETAAQQVTDRGLFMLREGKLETTTEGVALLRQWGEQLDRQYAEAEELARAALKGSNP